MGQAIREALQELLEHVDDDCPQEYRSSHLRGAIDDAREVLSQPEPTDPKNCPKCGTSDENINYGTLQSDAGVVWQNAVCVCGASWNELYKYSGLEDD